MTQLTIFEEPKSTAKTEEKINVVSLFSGCGGMDWGFAQAGFRILWANDIDQKACETYERNLGNTLFVGIYKKLIILRYLMQI
jgi:DNA (cytosine-5)-methyltransferase 1